jgi:predicted hotdog family 3-hydroxylacyl-ACP dehydratase
MLEIPITQLLPHRPPALLVQDVLETFDGGLHARVAWPEAEASPFLLIEAAAQSVAAYHGHQKTLNGEPVTEGFLVATRDFVFPASMPAGGIWSVRVQEIKNLHPFFLFETVILHDERPQATGTLTLFLKESM